MPSLPRLAPRLAAVFAVFGAALRVAAAEPPAAASIDLGGGVSMEFVLIAPGKFVMGSEPDAGERDETPAHRVVITRAFYLGKYEVTQRQWTAVMGDNPSQFQGASLPVDSVSWDDTQRFLGQLAAKTKRQFALPTEAQWEFACRAGTSTHWYFGENETALPEHAWVGANARQRTHAVGGKPANPWGVCDLYGNVWEWCADWYANPYPAAEAVDPAGPATGAARVLRGGAWGDDASLARSAYRNSMGPNQRNRGTGFRCVLLLASDTLRNR